ncbi:MAG: PspC domain-containing protein [Tannerellaceae bacterium]|jgi:phage shock protein PspC (stress-responsive transcriptional regulator)|nr:PspC domain-containing protein [Tannerellaceae bacterium]
MKTTLSVNLGGKMFHIDEDAYILLDKYVKSLRGYFDKEEGGEEILLDFEQRIAELFEGKLHPGYDVIGMREVEEVIVKMGKPEEICGGKTGEKTGRQWKPEKKKLYRDVSDKILGGVASGVAAYMGWDTTAVRLVFIALLFVPIGFPLYLILWLIMPPARTAAERLQMRGEEVTVENIGRTMTMPPEDQEETEDSWIRKVGHGITQVFGFVLKGLVVVLGVLVVPPIVFALTIMIIVLVSVSTGLMTGSVESIFFPDWWGPWNPAVMALVCICGVLVIVLPIGASGYALGSRLFGWREVSKAMKWTLVGLWVVSLIVSSFYMVHYAIPFWTTHEGVQMG